ncbi:hypothetical protein HDU97_010379 [Phlyctochytrium planicorne]|nr:hypothetical protein HDU97_010379 [Phlyctochytrium planicorne]
MEGDELDPLNSKYYAVIVQYIGKLNTQKLMNYARDLKNKAISKKHYNFRVTADESSFALTGYPSGGVTPIAMNQNIPIIISKSVLSLQPPVLWLGAGHVDWKVAFPVNSFVEASRSFVAEIE